MTITGYAVEFGLLMDGAPFGEVDADEEWSTLNCALYAYPVTISGGGAITDGVEAYDSTGATPATIVNDDSGEAYFSSVPAGRYVIVFDAQGDGVWQRIPRHRDLVIGIPEVCPITITGDGTDGPFGLTIDGGDGINTTCCPLPGRCHVWYMGRTLLTEDTDYTLTRSTVYPYTTDTITILHTHRGRGDDTILRADETLEIRAEYWPGGGYVGS